MSVPDQPLNKIRRSDRAKDDAWIQEFLRRGAMGTLATENQGQPFLVTRNYAYDTEHHAIYMHGAKKGRTIENIKTNNCVCFSVSEMGRLLPANEALEVGIEYAGVVIFGQVKIIEEDVEASFGLQLLMDKYFPHLKSGHGLQTYHPGSIENHCRFPHRH